MPGTKMMSPRGPTRLQLGLQHAAADREGGCSASVGQWIQFRNAELAGSIAGVGGDFVIIDCERGRIGTAADLALVVDAVAAKGASPIVRVLASELKRMRWAQDCGAHGVMVAMCETKAQAERTVVATGCPSPRFVVIVEIDSRRAVENVDDMAAVPGIDALFVGPHPLISPGSDTDSVPIAASADAVLAAARRHAKFAGHFAADADAAAALVRRGWQFVSCGPMHHVVGMQEEMARTAGEEMERLRRAMLGMRESPPPIEGEEYEWDGKDWG
ncbi:8-oxo-dGTP diphosphatase [Diplodia intermedia]|uniref:8-oxo-dGTP diphosphatase n=1 Tax=Diplodia intermedia TaxID=856260 RepID=A0ABR3TKA1_9PEZI